MAEALGFRLNAKSRASTATPLTALGANPRYGSTLVSNILTVIILCDAFAVAVGCWVVATRGIYKPAPDRQIYRGLARTHERHGTPVAAAWFVLAVVAGTIILTHVTNGVFSRATADPKVLLPEYAPLFYWLATLGPFLFLLIYLVICITAPLGLPGPEGRRGLWLAAAVGTLMIGGALFGTLYKAPSPYTLVPWWTAGWLGVGSLWLLVLRSRGGARASDPTVSPEESLVAAP
jgi:amino acid transporter